MSLFLHENHELNMLLVNTLQKVSRGGSGIMGWVCVSGVGGGGGGGGGLMTIHIHPTHTLSPSLFPLALSPTQDLKSSNMLEVSMALIIICKLIGSEMIPPLPPPCPGQAAPPKVHHTLTCNLTHTRDPHTHT